MCSLADNAFYKRLLVKIFLICPKSAVGKIDFAINIIISQNINGCLKV